MLLRLGLGVYVSHAGLEPAATPLLPQYWDYRCVPPSPGQRMDKEKLIFPNHLFSALADQDYMRARMGKDKNLHLE